MNTRVRDFFAKPQKWGSADCFRFVFWHCCDLRNDNIVIDWDAGYLNSKDEADLIHKLRKRGITMHSHLVDAFLKPLGLELRVGECQVGDILVFENTLCLASGKTITYPSLGIVDDDYNPIDYNEGGIAVCELPIKEVWCYGER